MSTNFYWAATEHHDRVHIGKRVAGVDGPTFIWAQDPHGTEEVLFAIKVQDGMVVDEYGRRWSARGFHDLVSHYRYEYNSIGKEFE